MGKREVKRYLISGDTDDDNAAVDNADDENDAAQEKMAASFGNKSKYGCNNHILTAKANLVVRR